MKKILFGVILLSAFALVAPSVSQAEGLVPCGGFILDADGNLITQSLADPVPDGWRKINDVQMAQVEPACTLCHLFQLINNILNWVLFIFIPILAPIFVIWGAYYLLIGGGDPGMYGKGKTILTATVVGLIIVYAAWVILNTVLTFLGVASWTGLGNWWQIECPM